MSLFIIDGKRIARQYRHKTTVSTSELKEKHGHKPTLVVILVGQNPASQVYVKAKTKAAEECGFTAIDIKLPETISNEDLQAEIIRFSSDPSVDGILLQLPLPKHLNEFQALLSIKPELDVDGLHPFNQGLLLRGTKAHQACTPLGSIRLLEETFRELGDEQGFTGKKVVVVGRSVLVGKPLGIMLLERNSTVTFCHSHTKDLSLETNQADILIAAIGKPEFIKEEFVKKDAIVIDVGINRLADGRIVGDVDFEGVKNKVKAITPVPGGVGPMTIAMLLQNTLNSAWQRFGR